MFELVPVAAGHPELEVVVAGQAHRADHLRNLVQPCLEFLWVDVISEPDVADHLQLESERLEVQLGVVATDHTVALEAPDAFGDGVRGEVDLAGKLLVAGAPVTYEQSQQSMVDAVHLRQVSDPRRKCLITEETAAEIADMVYIST